ncbi:MAG: hypothetical protein ETSY1_04335 [Candidatus Entotheonella factor]|uniref:Cytochrome c domain-containing protein n=1 Tax=Entotheonella factor TaxID=1429438 RepID=W4LXV8_ENTF1|nr:MAG: hypothetical protein ETSY1_04335 [Candidatus Entotheonella factor]
MHKTGRGYRQNGDHGRTGIACAALCIIAILMTSLAGAQGQAEMGQSIYTRHCARCHGADGRGGPMASMLSVPPRNLTDRAYMQARTEEQLFEVIKHGGSALGVSATMPGFGQQLSDEQIWDTVAFIRTLPGAASTARSQPEGAAPGDTPTGDLRIQRLSVSIWPEYDDPRVLVILRGELAPQSPLPTRIRIPLPKGAELLGAGMISPQNQLLNHPHERLEGDTSDTLVLTVPIHRFFAEWYYDPFGEREPARQFTYPFALPYAMAQLDVDILQPDAATDFRITPAPMREDIDTRGGKHHLFSYRDLQPDAVQTFEVAYVKTTDAPSITKSQAMSGDLPPGHPQVSGLSRSTKTWVAFAMVAGFAVIFAGGVLVFRNKQLAPATVPSTMPAFSASQAAIATGQGKTPETGVEADQPEKTAEMGVEADQPEKTAEMGVEAPNYCSNCGRQLQATYIFCPGCGRSLQA